MTSYLADALGYGTYGSTEEGVSKPWEKAVLDEETRMSLNGETVGQMEYARAVKAAGGVSLNKEDGDDTSKDQDWKYQEKPKTDMYVLFTTVIAQAIKLPVFLILLLILNAVPVLMCRIYVLFVPEPTDRVKRSVCFYFWFVVVTLHCIPSMIVVAISLLLDYLLYYIFSLLFCLCTWQWAQAMNGFEKIKPFRNGPSIILKMPDIFACVMGQSMRQGIFELNWMISMMFVLMPWLKYYICCNPWIYDLDHRLVQQISTGMGDLGDTDSVAEECRNVISRTRHMRKRAHRLDLWSFVPHYPYPPPDRRWHMGLQAGGGAYPGKFTLFVHTTHYDSTVLGSQEQLVISNSLNRPVYRVMLWYSNPFHFLTGWVEASISAGYPSQLDKANGGEHPMWLVSGHTDLTSGRDSFTGSGLIDAFFDKWLPVFVHEVRFACKYRKIKTEKGTLKQHDQEAYDQAMAYANEKYQQVESQDGVSTPHDKIGRHHYHDEDTLTELEKQGARECISCEHGIDSTLAKVGGTELGQKVGELLMKDELINKPSLKEQATNEKDGTEAKDEKTPLAQSA